MNKLKIGITSGDINGIGLEVILKTLSSHEVLKKANFYLFCSAEIIEQHQNYLTCAKVPFIEIEPGDDLPPNTVGLCDPWQRSIHISLGEKNHDGGLAALESLNKACLSMELKKLDALVTSPICKSNIPVKKNEIFTGHTGYLSQRFKSKTLMIMASGNTRIALATEHIPLSDVPKNLDKNLLKEKLFLFNEALKVDFGINNPKVAILGLNPHAGDSGAIGKEESQTIIPFVQSMKNSSILLEGPFSPDSFFTNKFFSAFDGVLALYHDQGLIPFKLLFFENGVNNTFGLPFVRSSPDHGVAFDIAGKNIASELSFKESLIHAIQRSKNRSRINKG